MSADPGGSPPRVVVYRRPGCPFCAVLRHGLRRAGLPVDEVDIWQDPAAAAFVRAHAAGTETVPTVDVAGTVLVNPSAAGVVALARTAGIEPVPARRWWPRRPTAAGRSGDARDAEDAAG